MSGWDNYIDTTGPQQGHGPGQAIPLQGFEDTQLYHPHGATESDTQPIFSLGQVQFTLPSALFALRCNNNILVLACTGSPPPSASSSTPAAQLPPQLIRIDLDRPTEVTTYDLPFPSPSSSSSSGRASAQPTPQLHTVSVDPLGRHCLISTTTGDNFYLFVGALPSTLSPSALAVAQRPKPLARLKGAVIDAVGWSPSSPSPSQPYSTKELLLGTSTGQVLETLLVDPVLASETGTGGGGGFSIPVPGRPSGPEKYVKQLYTLPVREGVVGLRYEPWAAQGGGEGGKRRSVAMVLATRTRVYQFVGLAERKKDGDEGAWLEQVMRPYAAGEVRPKTLELPGEPLSSELHFFAPPRSDGKGVQLPKSVAWMSGPGIYHGHLSFPTSDLPPGEGIIDSASLIPYPSLPSSSSSPSSKNDPPPQPLSMALTEWHFVLLYADRLVAVEVLTDRVVYDEPLDLPPSTRPLRLSTDPLRRTLWLHTDSSLYELVVRDEDRGVWRVYLGRGNWDAARKWAKTPAQRDHVLTSEADAAFSAGRFIPAAQAYAQLSSDGAGAGPDSRSFEEVVLRFVEKGERDALRYYLVARLERLKRTDLTPRALLATWLVEIYLAKLAELEDLAAAERASDDRDNLLVEQGLVEEDMRGFLETYKDNLDARTTFDLLAQHGRDELALFYASVVGDHERIVQHRIAEQEWSKALQALSKQDDLELYYRHASVLLRHVPKEAVDTFLRQPRLSVRRLIPALTAPRPPSSASPDSSATDHLIRYLQHSVLEAHNTDPAVHNTLLTLYASSPSPAAEAAFVSFLSSAPAHPHTSAPYYDLDYALRLCRAHGRVHACVVIYSQMGLYERAVDLALEHDELELAKTCADKPDEDEMLRKKLWLKVAKHVVGKKNDIKTAMRFLDSTTLLKIEDILPFFPDFVVIDDFKDEICDALEGYSAHIDRLKDDMNDATRAAEAIRADIAELDSRFVVVDANEKCGSCGQQLLTRQFYVFPCQHCFHADCLIQEVTKTLSPHQLRRMLSLQAQLAPSSSTSSARAPHRRATAGLGLLDDSPASLKLAAQASVQAVDQLRRLVLPDALLSVIGGAIPPLPGAVGGGGKVRLGANGRAVSGSGPAGAAGQDAAALAQSASARREAKEKLELREQLDELLAKECVLCEGAVASIERGFVEDGEEM
ncbi:hypothetical protein JCM10207_000722 [Rhodosporidiobolus poonsookiae]